MNRSARGMRRPSLLLPLLAVALLLGVAVSQQPHQTVQAGGRLPVAPAAAGDKIATTGDLVLQPTDVVEHDAIALLGNVVVPAGAHVKHDVVAYNGTIEIGGTVDHDVTTGNGDITLLASAHVGNSVTTLHGAIHRAQGAQVGGKTSESDASAPVHDGGVLGGIGRLLGNLVLGLVFVGLGAVVVLAWPRQTDRVVTVLEHALGPAALVGLLTGVLVLPVLTLLSVILVITLIGILVVPFLWVGLLLGWVYGAIVVGLWVGRRLGESGHLPAAQRSLLATALIGLGVVAGLAVVLLTFVPVLGWLAGYFLGFLGLGAAVLARLSTQGSLRRFAGGSAGPRSTHPLVPPADRRAS